MNSRGGISSGEGNDRKGKVNKSDVGKPSGTNENQTPSNASFIDKIKSIDDSITEGIKDLLPSVLGVLDPVTPIKDAASEVNDSIQAGTIDPTTVGTILAGVALKKIRGAGEVAEVVAGKLKKLDDKYLKREGIDAHAAKEELNMTTKRNAQFDLMVDKKTGRIYQQNKEGVLVETDYTFEELKKYAPLDK